MKERGGVEREGRVLLVCLGRAAASSSSAATDPASDRFKQHCPYEDGASLWCLHLSARVHVYRRDTLAGVCSSVAPYRPLPPSALSPIF